MDTKDLRSFMVVYEIGSINKAAKHLFITPQGLSKMIQNLEAELQTSLFERSMKGMQPTASGHYLYGKSRRLIEQIEEIKMEIRGTVDTQKRLRIGLACGVLNVVDYRLFEKCKEVYPEIHITWEELENQEVISRVQKGQIDAGFVIGTVADSNLHIQKLFKRQLDVLVYEGHPFYQEEKLSVEQLKDEPLICLNEKFFSYHSLIQRCADFGYVPDIRIKTMESQLIYKFCKEGIGLGIDVNIHEEDAMLGSLHRVSLVDAIPWHVSFVCDEANVNQKMIKVLEQLFLNK